MHSESYETHARRQDQVISTSIETVYIHARMHIRIMTGTSTPERVSLLNHLPIHRYVCVYTYTYMHACAYSCRAIMPVVSFALIMSARAR